MTTIVENLKKEISDYYIKDLKNQLWFFKSIAVLPIQRPIKDILMWKGEIPEKFDEVKEFWWRKDIINFVSPKLASEIFDFMKNKRLEIEKRKTEAELIELKNEILWLNPGQQNDWVDTSGDFDWGRNVDNWDVTEGNNWDVTEDNNWDTDLEAVGNEEDPWSQESGNSWWANWVVVWLGAATIWWGWSLALERVTAREARTAEQLMEQLDAEKMRATIRGAIEATEKKKKVLWSRLTKKQSKMVEKYIENLKNGIDGISWEAIDVLKERNSLWDKLKISRALLENCGLTTRDLWKISNMAKDLVWKSADEMKAMLKIKWIDDGIIEAFGKATCPEDILAMTHILSHWNKVPRMLQTLAGALRVDFAFTWLDVWMLIEQRKEAELISKVNELRWRNKYNQAWTQFWIWVWSVLFEWLIIRMMWWAATWWPIWAAVWLGVWILAMAASFGVDSLYFNVRDFYLQDQEDFLRQTRAQLKQAILQWFHNKKWWNQSLNERIAWLSSSMKPGWETKEKSLNDACASMIFLEEVSDDGQFNNDLLLEYIYSFQSKEDFLSDKDQNYKDKFEEIWGKMEDRINVRMQYIAKEFEKSEIADAINSWMWMQYLTTIFTNSRVFADLKEFWKWNDSKNFEENLQNYELELLSDFPTEKIQKFEDLKKKNPSLFAEIISTVSLESFIYWEEDEEKNEDYNYVQNVKMVVAYQKKLEMTQSVEDKRHINTQDIRNAGFIEKLLQSDFDLTKVEYPTQEPEKIIELVSINCERNWVTDISDDPLQNILYRLAKELFWYSGENDIQWLMGFFSESKDDNHGIYYSNKRKINDDWVIDTQLVNNLPKVLSEEKVDEYVTKFIKANFYTPIYNDDGDIIWYTPKSNIDTDTESMDNTLNKELRDKIQWIVREELLSRTKQKQDEVKKQILDFVKQYSKNWEYLELPYYLILDAKKAGLWDLQRQFFKRENNKLEICYLPSEINQTCLFDDAEKSYISPARESFTEEEQYYIDRVDNAYEKIKSTLNADLWLPTELQDIVNNKGRDREIFKENMLLYDTSVATFTDNIKKYEMFAEYFENLYRWILISISWFKLSNDISNINYFSMAMGYWNENLFDDKWNLLEWNEWNQLWKQQKFRDFYNEQIDKLKIWDKTIKELWNSESEEEKYLALRASNIIYTTVLEGTLMEEDWTISAWWRLSVEYSPSGPRAVWGYNDRRYRYSDRKDNIIKDLENKIKNLKIPPEIDGEKINNLMKKQTIQKLTNAEGEVTDLTPKLQDKIENTWKNINWKWKRWNIKYNPEKKVIQSRWKEIGVESVTEEKIKFVWLDVELTLEEWLRLANFKNWIKYTYWDKEVEFWRDTFNKKLSWRKTFKIDWTMLLSRWDLEKYCSVCKSDEVVEKITDWLNKN